MRGAWIHKVFLQKLEVRIKHLKVSSVAQVFETRRLAGISCSSVCKQEDWLGSVGQVFVNKKITFTYIVDDMLKLSDQSCSRTAKDQLYKGVFRTVSKNKSVTHVFTIFLICELLTFLEIFEIYFVQPCRPKGGSP